MKLLLSVLLSFCLLDCVSNLLAAPPELPVLSHAGQIAGRVYKETRCEEFRFLDPLLVRPTREQFVEMVKFCAANRTKGYEHHLWDCDDFAREAKVFSARWAKKTFSGLPAGIAVGIAVVTIEGHIDGLGFYGNTPSLHAMNVVLLADGRVALLEPMDSKWIFPLSAVYEGLITFHSIEF